MGKETPDIISNGVCWKPGQFFLNTPKHFPKFYFLQAQELQIPKMEIFRRCLEIEGKARYLFRET